MSKSNSERVFFFTLIDLFIQVIFLGLLLFATSQAINNKKSDKNGDYKDITNELTALSPDGKGWKDHNDLKSILRDLKVNSPEGDVAKSIEHIKKIKSDPGKFEKYFNGESIKSPCVEGKVVASILPRDGFIRFINLYDSGEFINDLKSIGVSMEVLKHEFTRVEFKKTFMKNNMFKNKSCAYIVELCRDEDTKLIDGNIIREIFRPRDVDILKFPKKCQKY